MPTFSAESKTLREVMHFSSKHADDVLRGVGGSGKAERVTQAVNNMSEFLRQTLEKRLGTILERRRNNMTGKVFMSDEEG